jgi:dipeptidyl aminopeptidase/acylaminoacyl peptidase
MVTDLFVMDVDSGESKKLTDTNMSIGACCWSPDNKHIAFKGNNLRRGFATHTTIWVILAEGGKPTDLTGKLDRGSARHVYYDLRGPISYLLAPFPVWSEEWIYFSLSDRGHYSLHRVNPRNGEIKPVVTGNFLVDDFSVAGNVVVYLKVTETAPAEVCVKDERGERNLTNLNDFLLSELRLSVPEHFEYQASDGKKIDGWLIKPVVVEKGEKVPAILDIHGGPKSVFGYSFMFEHHFFSSKGFAVIYLNPRGSDGYSEEFADIRGAYGERDFKDIMEGLDYVLSKFRSIDPDRIGVTGLSYGGFMTNWIVTHTDRFKAAVSQNSISDWTAMFGTTDIGFYFSPDQIGKEPWSNPQGYLNKSPLTYAPKVTTPTMFIHSAEDFRCWIDQSISFFTALKFLGKETELVLFDKGEHTFRSTSKPSFRMRRLEHMLRWFEQYLRNK